MAQPLPPIRQTIAVGLLILGLATGILSLFLSSWWSVDVVQPESSQGQQNEFTQLVGDEIEWYQAEPYDSHAGDELEQLIDLARSFAPEEADAGIDEQMSRFEQTLDSESMVAGILVTVSVALQAGAVGLLVGSYFIPVLQPWMGHGLAFVAILVGLTCVILAPLSWPSAYERGNEENAVLGLNVDAKDASWFGSEKIDVGDGEQATIDYYPNLGWYLAIVGLIALPAAAGAAQYMPKRRPDLEEPPPTTEFKPAAPPPALPTHVPGVSPPPPAPSFRPAAVTPSTPVKRISVVKKAAAEPEEAPKRRTVPRNRSS